jgi:hypothetical protein
MDEDEQQVTGSASDNTGLLNSAIEAANSFIAQVGSIQLGLQEQLEQALMNLLETRRALLDAQNARNDLQRQLNYCRNRRSRNLEDLPGVLSGELVIVEDGVMDADTGFVITD